MKASLYRKHRVEFIFPIALLFLIGLCALTILMMAVHIYGKNTASLARTEENYFVLTYLQEKIRQNDMEGEMELIEVEGTNVLSLKSFCGDTPCWTYLYAWDGSLKELFFTEGAQVELETGTSVAPCLALTMEETEKGLFRFTTTNEEGTEISLLASERSEP